MKKEYIKKFEMFKAGKISEAEWRKFCDKFFLYFIEENKAPLVRLFKGDQV